MNKKTVSILSGAAGIFLAGAIYSEVLKFPAYAVHASQYVKFLLAVTAMMSPKTMNPAMIFSRISTTLPKTETTSATIGLALESGSAQAVAVAVVTSPMDCAVIFSPFISSFCRADRAPVEPITP